MRQADVADTLQTRPGGYLLAVAEDAVDVVRFERAVAGARLARLDGVAPDAISSAFRDALALWAGPALADVNGEPFVAGERRRLEELRLAATDDYLTAELAGGRHAEAVGELERMVDSHPLRERLWELLITALYRSGRQADALAAYQRVRRILADELGIEPSAPLRELEQKVLLQDSDLAAPATSPRPVSHSKGESLTASDVEPPLVDAKVRPSRGLARTREAGKPPGWLASESRDHHHRRRRDLCDPGTPLLARPGRRHGRRRHADQHDGAPRDRRQQHRDQHDRVPRKAPGAERPDRDGRGR